MKQRATVLRRIFEELTTRLETNGWWRAEGTKTMLEMKAAEQEVEHTLLVQEPLPASQLPSPDVLGLSCSVNVYFEELETVISEAFGHDVETRGKVSVSLSLCQLAPKGSCHLGSVYLILPTADLGDSLKQFLSDYQKYLEPVRLKLANLKIFRDGHFVPPSVALASWNMRRAAYGYLYEGRDTAIEWFDQMERQAVKALDMLPPKISNDRSVVFGSVAAAAEAGARRSTEELQQLISTLRRWTLENRKRRGNVH